MRIILTAVQQVDAASVGYQVGNRSGVPQGKIEGAAFFPQNTQSKELRKNKTKNDEAVGPQAFAITRVESA